MSMYWDMSTGNAVGSSGSMLEKNRYNREPFTTYDCRDGPSGSVCVPLAVVGVGVVAVASLHAVPSNVYTTALRSPPSDDWPHAYSTPPRATQTPPMNGSGVDGSARQPLPSKEETVRTARIVAWSVPPTA